MYAAYNRYHHHQQHHPRSESWWNDEMATSSSSKEQSTRQRPQQRYARSSTASVAQLLSDSCSSLLQKLTTKVRGPSESVTTTSPKRIPLTTSKSTTTVPNLGSTRHRLEDKYASVLEKIYGRKQQQKEQGALSKSATTTNVLLSEKAFYPFTRDKTPYRNDHYNHSHKLYHQHYQEPPYSYLDQDSAASRLRHRSNHSELRPRRSAKPIRNGKSEIAIVHKAAVVPPPPPPPLQVCDFDDELTPTPQQPPDLILSEREAKRKEIQSLIMKYSALDEVYNRGNNNNNNNNVTNNNKGEGGIKVASPINKNLTNNTTTSSSTSISKKYYATSASASKLVAVVSKKKWRFVSLLSSTKTNQKSKL